ncbi:hypothetical protein GTR02_17130 [Kineococcus sp. R8]|uniref:hypothetical protein n=1 Tax=Kineococcus siccus TaxID=2696567 RepID=UPI001412D7DD|nr:hypothetical protein [Kineococcus siccus]NAZ83542.1 hypothetical protein [Kineococcus siccus]
MRSAGSWGIRLTMPQALLLGLHLRDAAGLRPPPSEVLPELPPLHPAVTPLRADGAAIAGGDVAAQQWGRWWASAFPGGPEALTSILPPLFGGLRGMTELRGLAELGIDDAVAWAAEAREREARLARTRPLALFETNLVAEVERTLGRRIRPFTLEVVVLPLRGIASWDVAGHPVVTEELRADRDAYLTWLRDRLLGLRGAGERRDAAPPSALGD